MMTRALFHRCLTGFLFGVIALFAAVAPVARATSRLPVLPVRTVRFDYTTHDGKTSYAIVLLPGWYGPTRHPALPLIICPHGRNTVPESTVKRWRDLPTRGGFAVVIPAGQGRVLQLDSWGYPGQIDDLARMPDLVEHAVGGFRYERNRVYAIGESMGGQEVLLLAAKYPHLLAGAIAFDPAVDMVARYYAFPALPGGGATQAKARIEIGGTPQQVPQAYAVRSPIDYVRQLALSGVPLQLWWSINDKVIVDQSSQAGRMYQEIKLVNAKAPVSPYVGRWHHTAEGIADTQLPDALARIGLLSPSWHVDDPLHFHHGRNAQPRGHLASEREVDRLVASAQARITKRLTHEDTLVSTWWRTVSVGLALLALSLAAALMLQLRRARVSG
jgi:poly(3-hydroxybutyrate) depolymerase